VQSPTRNVIHHRAPSDQQLQPWFKVGSCDPKRSRVGRTVAPFWTLNQKSNGPSPSCAFNSLLPPTASCIMIFVPPLQILFLCSRAQMHRPPCREAADTSDNDLRSGACLSASSCRETNEVPGTLKIVIFGSAPCVSSLHKMYWPLHIVIRFNSPWMGRSLLPRCITTK